ncbi:MAG: DUF4416 family protein [Spirochaetota bacterium]|nr:DUF4416 family protein [Spirochaetota bacterium]
MAQPVIPVKAKLFIGILTNSDVNLYKAERILEKRFGRIDYCSMKMPFTHTEYYSSIGTNLFRIFFSFEKLIKREKIVKIKLYTNRLEKKLSGQDRRSINIDPGYLTLSNVFLASCKDFFHRMYISKGVYLENEYRYVGRNLKPWDWTYPDYRKQEYIDYFLAMRRIYYKQIRDR